MRGSSRKIRSAEVSSGTRALPKVNISLSLLMWGTARAHPGQDALLARDGQSPTPSAACRDNRDTQRRAEVCPLPGPGEAGPYLCGLCCCYSSVDDAPPAWLLSVSPAAAASGTWNATYGHFFTLRHTSFSRDAVLTISKPVAPPKVLGFQYSGEQMGFPRSPFSENGAPISTMLSPKMPLGWGFSSSNPG